QKAEGRRQKAGRSGRKSGHHACILPTSTVLNCDSTYVHRCQTFMFAPMVKGCQLVSFEAALAYAGDARGLIAVRRGVEELRQRGADLRDRQGRGGFFSPAAFLRPRTTPPAARGFDGDANPHT